VGCGAVSLLQVCVLVYAETEEHYVISDLWHFPFADKVIYTFLYHYIVVTCPYI